MSTITAFTPSNIRFRSNLSLQAGKQVICVSCTILKCKMFDKFDSNSN